MADTLARWRSEKTAAYLSGAVAAAETDPGKAALFRQMAEAAEAQAAILAGDLAQVPTFEPSLRSRITAFLVRSFGPRAMRKGRKLAARACRRVLTLYPRLLAA